MIAEKMFRLSVLDLSPVSSGSSSTDALRNTLDLARLAGEAGVGELMVTTMTHEHEARRRSYALLAEAFGLSPH